MEDFDKCEVGHASFKAQQQEKDLLKTFENKVLDKFEFLENFAQPSSIFTQKMNHGDG